MSPNHHVHDAGSKGFAKGLAEDLAIVLRDAATDDLLVLDSTHPALDAALSRWARSLGYAIVEKTPRPGGGVRYLVRLGGVPDLGDDGEGAATRLWIYSNFQCNLACDYCCVRSSPRAEPGMIDVATIRRLASEAPGLGFRRIFLTGGEPFLRPDLDEVVLACTESLPTTLLTNAMLWEGPRRTLLERMPRDRLTLQVSLDSPDPTLHDRHRGKGSWARARAGIALARSLAFRVRVAATTHSSEQADEMRRFLEAEGIPPADRVVRPVARRGAAQEGVPLLRSDLRPELTITARGVYWHPVGATDDDFRVLDGIGPLELAVAAVRERERQDRLEPDRLPSVFHCA
ncbi:MAG: radical SAM protein [Euryarchaeota archaeon]|nr:radical SAM protein [Euryarchaeota archaeon]